LLAEALGPLGGRARLFARLGPEAAEPVDELLAACLHYGTLHAPSLQGFLQWLDLAGAEVKREAEAAGDAVRIMTVHGAKGLEAPVVILPDTVAQPPDDERLHWTQDPQTGTQLFLWAPNKAFRCTAVEALRAQAAGARAEEYNRLLYVALTRARDHLLICGWQPRGETPDTSWYALVADGLARAQLGVAGAIPQAHPWGTALCLSAPQTAEAEAVGHARATDPTPLPAWLGAAPLWQPGALPPEPALPRPLSPSRPDGVRLGAVPPARSPLRREAASRPQAARRGELVHTLLQYLPSLPEDAREAAALRFAATVLSGQPDNVEQAIKLLVAQVLAVLSDPSLAALFGPASRAEQALTGVVEGQVITGRVDRLAVLPEEVVVADYKTARAPPTTPEAVPVFYLRQLAAYRAVLQLLYPNRPVRCVLIWTEGPIAMTIPGAVLANHAPRFAQLGQAPA
jgi:ATP-dependent helicase/nuclease subunit A